MTAAKNPLGGGLLIGGRRVVVPGHSVINQYDDPRCRLDPGDYSTRKAPRVSQIILHTTKGIWPQRITPGAGPPGKHLAVADFWRGDPEHSAAPLVVGRAGEISCLCDLLLFAAHHATASNRHSVGIEMYQERDGSIREATLAATVALVLVLCAELGIQLQVPMRAYRNAPMARMVDGGPGVFGVLGHRDNTSRRGRGDPGDEIFVRLCQKKDAGGGAAEALIADNGHDLHVWAQRQRAMGFPAAQCDGIPGPRTTAALKERGFPGGIWALGTDAQRAELDGLHHRSQPL
jgi:N-acetylmuramoyl-L-alanine amidase